MKELAYLNKYFYKYRWKLVPGVIFVIISNYFGILPAKVIREAFDLVQENIYLYKLYSGFERQELIYKVFGSSLLFFGGVVLLLSLLRGIFLFMMRQTIILTSRHIEYDLKNEIYRHYQKLDFAFFRRNNTGDLMSRATEDVNQVRNYLGPAIMYAINTVVLSIMVIYAMYDVNARLATYALIPIPILSVVILFVNKIINKRSEKIQKQLARLASFVQENFAGIRVIKTYNREKYKMDAFEDESTIYRNTALSLVKVQAVFFPLILLLIGLSTIITIYVGGLEVAKGTITAGNIAEFIIYVNQLTFPAMSLAWVTSLVQRASASQKRINEFLNTNSPIINGTTKKTLSGDLKVEHISFTYPETGIQAIKDLSFHIPAGQTLAIIGKTGSGKSTLANLLLRMFDIEKGSIKYDDVSIKDLDYQDLRQQTGFVPQEVFLFSDTISNNIAFGLDHFTQQQVEQAAKDAAVYENIIGFDQGFETSVGERGITLSGGQKQRVSIARALIKEPKILIFDDCLSAVDTKTEEQILTSLSRIMKGKTCVFIAHRVSTIKNADKIIVLDQGKIAEEGSHEELMNLKGQYFELHEKQLLEAI
ncbi:MULTISPECIES: ABC transporter ATP-binding protein [Sphingobacterium]|jgi:ATP-binding cassette subfamily B multidrug efflux pump|uniref:ABC transporter ATP-binding protein n=1 Tax=Sphingobacterium TaxID=28453 RepID=UPI00097F52C3|nr:MULTISPECIES: ABC transporter ATP-binding protein [Sphingobacterium]UPZ34905.1 ABC transporter ATP-binding protein/permease [Sphingobacterium sp. PCS056]UXD70482.1 ABC transporter ATP-binding protein/permease [Sphingobacterium faecium]WGQ14054.1 ABC transporter ATP-binding protein [Sphingobacterium faecium]SJN51539.1 ABC transporter, transmembrane region:ABC transporter [Sphingobacterium faecium PCAi_F2.5]